MEDVPPTVKEIWELRYDYLRLQKLQHKQEAQRLVDEFIGWIMKVTASYVDYDDQTEVLYQVYRKEQPGYPLYVPKTTGGNRIAHDTLQHVKQLLPKALIAQGVDIIDVILSDDITIKSRF